MVLSGVIYTLLLDWRQWRQLMWWLFFVHREFWEYPREFDFPEIIWSHFSGYSFFPEATTSVVSVVSRLYPFFTFHNFMFELEPQDLSTGRCIFLGFRKSVFFLRLPLYNIIKFCKATRFRLCPTNSFSACFFSIKSTLLETVRKHKLLVELGTIFIVHVIDVFFISGLV